MKSVTRQVSLKLKLERIFKPEVSKVFNGILRDFRITVATTGQPPTIDNYRSVWETVLKNHFYRVQKTFTGVVKQVDDMTLRVFLNWRNKYAPEDATFINLTTRVNMVESIQAALNQAAEDFKILSNRELSADATAILKRKLKTRIDRIINTETQKAAEAAKFMEAEVLSGVTPRILGGGGNEPTGTTKRWTTVGDKFVRNLHREANGQVRKLNEPYLVGGEYLMHPGDTSLGASIGNVANCRCVSTYRFN